MVVVKETEMKKSRLLMPVVATKEEEFPTLETFLGVSFINSCHNLVKLTRNPIASGISD